TGTRTIVSFSLNQPVCCGDRVINCCRVFGAGYSSAETTGGTSMRIELTVVGAVLLLAASGEITSAEAASPAPVVSHPSTSALSDLPTAHWVQTPDGLKLTSRPKPLLPHGAGPSGPHLGDKALQSEPGAEVGIQPKASFGGIGANGYIPPDPNIAVGKNNPQGIGYIVQMVNSELAIFDKSGNLIAGPVSLSTLWQPLG